MNRFFLFASALAVTILFTSAGAAFAGIWEPAVGLGLEGVDSYQGGSSLAVQSDGKIHVAYERQMNDGPLEIAYQTNQSGVFAKQVVAAGSVMNTMPDIAVRAGRAHVVYVRGNTVFDRYSEIIYKTNADGAWTSRKISSNTNPDGSPAIAVGGNAAHFAWVGYSAAEPGSDIYYRSFNYVNGATRQVRLTTDRQENTDPDIAVGAGGLVHIVYTKVDGEGDREVVYATNPDGKWRRRAITANVDFEDDSPAVALYNGVVYIPFVRAPGNFGGPGQLYLATNAGGEWRLKRITDEKGGVVGRPQIAVDGGKIRLLYTRFNPLSEGLDVQYRTNASGVWKRVLLEAGRADAVATGIGTAGGPAHVLYETWDSSNRTGGLFYQRQR